MYDVVIVGASLAGCTAAVLFAREGLRVALLERESDVAAYKPICTHFIQSSTLPTLQRLGLSSKIEAAGGLPNGFEMWTQWGWIRCPGDSVRYGYNIRREILDPMLRAMAANTSGVTFMPGRTVSEVLTGGEGIVGVRAQDGSTGSEEFRARLIVAADGQNSRVADRAGLLVRRKPNARFAYFAHYRDLPLVEPKLSQLWFHEPNLAYSFPNDSGHTVLTVAPLEMHLAAWKRDVEANFISTFEALPRAPLIREGKRVTPFRGMLKLPSQSRAVTAPGLALIGDAALASDPVWGAGCGWAFRSAEWLVDCTAPALRGGQALAAPLSAYRRRHRRELAGHAWLIADFATGRPFNALERLMFSAAARDPICAAHFGAFGGREISVSRFLSPLALARAAKVNLAYRIRKTEPMRMQAAG